MTPSPSASSPSPVNLATLLTLLVLLLQLLSGAAGQLSFTSPSSVIYGTPVLISPRLSADGQSLFVVDTFGNRALRINVTSGDILVEYRATSPVFDTPYAVEYDPRGREVYVIDSTDRLVQFSLDGRQLMASTLPALLTGKSPYALAVDRLGFLYIALSARAPTQTRWQSYRELSVVKMRTGTGEVVAVWNASEVLLGSLTQFPAAFTVVGDSSLVITVSRASFSAHLLTINTVDGSILSVAPLPFEYAKRATGVCVDRTGSSLYVAYSASVQTLSDHVVRYSIDPPHSPVDLSSSAVQGSELVVDASQRLFLTSVTTPNLITQLNFTSGDVLQSYTVPLASTSGAFVNPSYIAVDSQSNVYAAYSFLYTDPSWLVDYPVQLIARVSPQGQPAGFINTTSTAASLGLGIDSQDRLISFTSETVRDPTGRAIRRDGWLWVFDALSGRLLSSTNLTTALAGHVTSSAVYSGFALDAADVVYIASFSPNHRILQMRLDSQDTPYLAHVFSLPTMRGDFLVETAHQLLFVSNCATPGAVCPGLYVSNLTTGQAITQLTTSTGVDVHPVALRMDAAGRVYVADSYYAHEPRVLVVELVYPANGTQAALQVVANYTSYNALSSSYRDLALDPAGRQVYVADAGGIMTFPSFASAVAGGSSSSGGAVTPQSSTALLTAMSGSSQASSTPQPSSTPAGPTAAGTSIPYSTSGVSSSSPAPDLSSQVPPPTQVSSSSGGGVAPPGEGESSGHTMAIAATVVVVLVVLVVAAMLLAWRAGWDVPCLRCCRAGRRDGGEMGVEDGAYKAMADDSALLTDRDGYQHRGTRQSSSRGTELSSSTVKW